MGWVRISDDFYDHDKFTDLTPLAFAAWVCGLAWANRNLSSGELPANFGQRSMDFSGVGYVADQELHVDTIYGADEVLGLAITELVEAGLLHRVGHDCESCPQPRQKRLVIHDYLDYQPSREKVLKEREAARVRMNSSRNTKRSSGDVRANTDGTSNEVQLLPTPTPREEHVASRDDVTSLCSRLADRIEANGSKRPTITKSWTDSARLLLDNDKRDHAEALKLIDWSQASDFWRPNVLSMKKFREKYDTLRLQADRDKPKPTRNPNIPEGW